MKKSGMFIKSVIILLIVPLLLLSNLMGQKEFLINELPIKTGNEYLDIFRADGDHLITKPEDMGIVNGLASVGINYNYVGIVSGLWAPPYVSSDFFIEPRLWGERVKTDHYTWLPYQTNEIGRLKGINVKATITLIYGMRSGVVSLTLENTTGGDKNIPLQLTVNDPFTYKGTLDYEKVWGFGAPKSHSEVTDIVDNNGIHRIQGNYAVALGGSLKDMKWEEPTRRFHSKVHLTPRQKKIISFVFSIGDRGKAIGERDAILTNPSGYIGKSTETYISKVKDIFSRLPRFRSDNRDLEELYNRSLSILIMNKFEVPEFVLNPYYATGSIKGGCYKNYLWNFAGISEILPLFDPQADKKHILQFIRSGGLYNGHSFDPITGEGNGTWYPVNQEKIIELTYCYVKNTGDTAFLREEVANGETVLDHMIRNAMHLTDKSMPEALVDYGSRGDHLELRRKFTYNHILPDVNGLRYKNYQRVAELCDLAGSPQAYLMERAKELKKILKRDLWDPGIKWFIYADEKGNKDVRYTVQMFYLLNSDVIDDEIEKGLLSHLNDEEFLSDYGLHSMSKKDSAYDQVDIDNGGGGSCTIFPPQIAELLYKNGKVEMADQIMGRILWWGQRLPYFGDSQVANEINYRQDTPLQADIGTGSLAQSILFGMMGINASLDGSIIINPVKTKLARKLKVKGLKIHGKTIDISVVNGNYEVISDGKIIRHSLGAPTIIKN